MKGGSIEFIQDSTPPGCTNAPEGYRVTVVMSGSDDPGWGSEEIVGSRNDLFRQANQQIILDSEKS